MRNLLVFHRQVVSEAGLFLVLDEQDQSPQFPMGRISKVGSTPYPMVWPLPRPASETMVWAL